MADALLKMGFPPEQLDIIAEYGGQLTRAGYNAEEVQAYYGSWGRNRYLELDYSSLVWRHTMKNSFNSVKL